MLGKCLCGAVQFTLSGMLPDLYQCHCSLCRKVSGSSANAAFKIDRAQLCWDSGEDLVQRYQSDTGFKAHFCSRCGSPLPNLTANNTAWWVPVGLLEHGEGLRVAAHLFVASRAPWDVIAKVEDVEHFDEMPDADQLDRLLRRTEYRG
jgi:hypothetical protein